MRDYLNRQPKDTAIKHKYCSGAKTSRFSNICKVENTLNQFGYCFYIPKIAKSRYHLRIASLGNIVIFYDITGLKGIIFRKLSQYVRISFLSNLF